MGLFGDLKKYIEESSGEEIDSKLEDGIESIAFSFYNDKEDEGHKNYIVTIYVTKNDMYQLIAEKVLRTNSRSQALEFVNNANNEVYKGSFYIESYGNGTSTLAYRLGGVTVDYRDIVQDISLAEEVCNDYFVKWN